MIDFRAEHTGNAAVDRIQAAIRALASLTSSAVAVLRRNHGTGVSRIVMQDAARTLSPAEAACARIALTGTLSAARVLVFPDATDATAYTRWVTNTTTGGFALTITTGQGTASLAASSTRCIEFSGSGPAFLT